MWRNGVTVTVKVYKSTNFILKLVTTCRTPQASSYYSILLLLAYIATGIDLSRRRHLVTVAIFLWPSPQSDFISFFQTERLFSQCLLTLLLQLRMARLGKWQCKALESASASEPDMKSEPQMIWLLFTPEKMILHQKFIFTKNLA